MRHTRAERGRRRAGGFTLIETCIALLILMVVGLGVASLFVYSIGYNWGGGTRAQALAIGQQRMEELRSVPFANIETAVANNPANPVTFAGQQFNVTTTVTYTPAAPATPLVKTITIDVAAVTAGGEAWAAAPVRFVTARSTPLTGSYSK